MTGSAPTDSMAPGSVGAAPVSADRSVPPVHPTTVSRSTIHRFRAPWSSALRIYTCLILMLLAAGSFLAWAMPNPEHPNLLIWMIGGSISFLILGFLLSVRGYEVTDRGLRILRGGWSTWLAWESLDFVEFEPKASRRSWRLFGMSAFFAYAGWFWNREYGCYRLYGTDLTRTVLLRFGRQTVMVTPDPPIEFVNSVDQMAWAPRSQ